MFLAHVAAVFLAHVAAVPLAHAMATSLACVAAMCLAHVVGALRICVEPVLWAHVMDGYWPGRGSSIARVWQSRVDSLCDSIIVGICNSCGNGQIVGCA